MLPVPDTYPSGYTDVARQLATRGIELRSWGPGTHYTTCPECSPHRRKRTARCLTVWITPDRASWHCNHCGNKGSTSAETPYRVLRKTPLIVAPAPPAVIPWEVVWASTNPVHYVHNNFAQWLTRLMGAPSAMELLRTWHVGTAKDGSTVFWLVDWQQQPRQPRLVRYGPDGRRDKRHTGRPPMGFTAENGFRPCLFGEHQLADQPDVPVAVVESEKNAIAGSIVFPEWIWVAVCGAANYVSRLKACEPLRQRHILLFPDADPAGRAGAAQAFRQLQGFARSIAVLDLWPEREDGYDLADYFAAGFQGEDLPLPNPRTTLSSLPEIGESFPMPKPSATVRIQELIPEDNPLRFTASADAAVQFAAMLKQRPALAEFLRKFSPCLLSLGDHIGPIQEWQLSIQDGSICKPL